MLRVGDRIRIMSNCHGSFRGYLFWRMKSAYQQELEARLTVLVEPAVVEAGVELVELQFVQRKSSALLRVLVDKVGGVTLDQCAELSHRLSFLLEATDPIEGRYTLEVSSPGLDRALTTAADFRRKVGETVRVTLSAAAGGREVVGEIIAMEDNRLTLQTETGEQQYSLDQVVRAKIIF